MSELTDFRKAKDRFFAQDRRSPLTPHQRREFRGLGYFPENPQLMFVLQIHELPDQDKEVIEMTTTTGESRPHQRWGTMTFEVDGQPVKLTVYKGVSDGDLFLPFADATSGKETYGAGRYLDLVPLADGRFVVDFNYAYNPRWSCPIPPSENRLRAPIRAGEKNFPDTVGHSM